MGYPAPNDKRGGRMNTRSLVSCILLALAGGTAVQAQVPPVAAPDQLALLNSDNPREAANKKLVFDMYRAIVQGGHTEMAEQYFTPATSSTIRMSPVAATNWSDTSRRRGRC